MLRTLATATLAWVLFCLVHACSARAADWGDLYLDELYLSLHDPTDGLYRRYNTLLILNKPLEPGTAKALHFDICLRKLELCETIFAAFLKHDVLGQKVGETEAEYDDRMGELYYSFWVEYGPALQHVNGIDSMYGGEGEEY